jgi:hypothetical protein
MSRLSISRIVPWVSLLLVVVASGPGCVVVVRGRPPIVFYDAWSADYVEVSWAATAGVLLLLVASSAALGATGYWYVRSRWFASPKSQEKPRDDS